MRILSRRTRSRKSSSRLFLFLSLLSLSQFNCRPVITIILLIVLLLIYFIIQWETKRVCVCACLPSVSLYLFCCVSRILVIITNLIMFYFPYYASGFRVFFRVLGYTVFRLKNAMQSSTHTTQKHINNVKVQRALTSDPWIVFPNRGPSAPGLAISFPYLLLFSLSLFIYSLSVLNRHLQFSLIFQAAVSEISAASEKKIQNTHLI